VNDAFDKLLRIEESIRQSRSVKLWILQAVLIRDILLENSKSKDRQRRIKKIVHRYEHWIEDGLKRKSRLSESSKAITIITHLSTESTEKCIPEVAQCECKIFVEEISKELAHPVITPAAMNEQESLQVPELSY
jgi:hypothetical protein